MVRKPFLLLTSLLLVSFVFSNTSSSGPATCHDHERSALLEFKQGFFRRDLCGDNGDPEVVGSWDLGAGSKAGDCCSWESVKCDAESGYVTGLDLAVGCLYGHIDSNTSLFRLVRLQSLSLALNDFGYSAIPAAIGNLSELASLDLSSSSFHGQVPWEVLKLTNLTFLDLSGNLMLQLINPSLENLVQSLTKLEDLYLQNVHLQSPLPNSLANLTSLRSVSLNDCGLQGEFPTTIFELPRLEYLCVSNNIELSVHLPEFHRSSPIKSLILSSTKFSGQVPASLGNSVFFSKLEINNCGLSGNLLSSIGNLTQLQSLSLNNNKLEGEIPSWLGKLVQLTWLDLSSNQLSGEIPHHLMNLTQLEALYLNSNQLSGGIPSEIASLTQLGSLDLSSNGLQGPIPRTISTLKNLNYLMLSSNKLNGALPMDAILDVQKLVAVQLSFNKFSTIIEPNINSSLPGLLYLGLAGCQLSEFPKFLASQHSLQLLDLSYNNIYGQVPEWFLNVSKFYLISVNLSGNSLTSFPVAWKWENLDLLDLRDNDLQGLLPNPPASVRYYFISNNRLSGKISETICQLSYIVVLDLANNTLKGTLPTCLNNLSDTLSTLNLRGNKFYGRIPQLQTNMCQLKMIDCSDNLFQGPLPRGLANCTRLEFLNFGNNQIVDAFPSWLGSLPDLKVLLLHSNGFRGAIGDPKAKHVFPMLQIIDLSANEFSGNLPSNSFACWRAMKVFNIDQASYNSMTFTTESSPIGTYLGEFHYSMMVVNKGILMEYQKIWGYLTLIDLSRNNFSGTIPNAIGSLKGLQLLNISNNALDGSIPSSLGNLTNLEALDLSRNKLIGEIPKQLLNLNFLDFFNVSDNHLVGPIPSGKQFNTFGNDSYGGNLGLCGDPLTKSCGNPDSQPPPPHGTFDKKDSRMWGKEVDWIIILMGFGSGFFVSIVTGHKLTTRIQHWFVKEYCQGKRRRRAHKRYV